MRAFVTVTTAGVPLTSTGLGVMDNCCQPAGTLVSVTVHISPVGMPISITFHPLA